MKNEGKLININASCKLEKRNYEIDWLGRLYGTWINLHIWGKLVLTSDIK